MNLSPQFEFSLSKILQINENGQGFIAFSVFIMVQTWTLVGFTHGLGWVGFGSYF